MLRLVLFFSLLLTACQAGKKARVARLLQSQRKIVVNYLNKGMPAQAHQELRKILEERPDDLVFLRLMGVAQLALDNPEKAVAYFQLVYRKDKEIVHGLNLSSALIASGAARKAEKLLSLLLQKAEKQSYNKMERLYHNLALIHEKKNNFRKARQLYKQALGENPAYYLTLLRLALLHKKRKNYPKAVHYFGRASNFCRKCFEPVQHLVSLYMHLGEQQKAVRELTNFSKQMGLQHEERNKALATLKRIYPQKQKVQE